MQIVKLLLLVLLAKTAYAELPHLPYQAIPGGVVTVPLNIYSEEAPYVEFNKKEAMRVQSESGEWQAVIGIPLAQTEELVLFANQKPIFITIEDHQYREQHIEIKNKRKVNPLQQDMDRIGREYGLMTPVYKSFSDYEAPEWAQMIKPVNGIYTSPFGLKRFFNGQPRKPHSGIDIAAAEGTAIKAPASGVIALTGDFFFNGQSVFIDHGQGLVSMMCHMSRIDVQEGQEIKQGEIIGAVGKTGRATGPHVHWTVSLNNARVNPFLFMPDEEEPKNE